MPNSRVWRKNLWVCAIVAFIVSCGMSQFAPVLPLYIAELGITDTEEISRWSGIIFGCNFMSLALISPFWGALADRRGRKLMVLRATLWISLCTLLMGMAQNVWQLAALRIAQGLLSGFQGALFPLVMSMVPQKRSSWAMSVLVTGIVSGTLIGPLIGGWISTSAGLRENFIFMAICTFIGFFLILFLVHEQFTPPADEDGTRWIEHFRFPVDRPLVLLFLTTFATQFALMSVAPVITVYVTQLAPDSESPALLAGSVFAATGIASLFFATKVGRFLDAHTPARVLPWCIFCTGLLCIPQAFVNNVFELGGLRFLFGVTSVGILPALNSLIKCHMSEKYLARASSVNFSHQAFGIFLGSVMGGFIASYSGVEYVFLCSACLLFLNAMIFYLLFPKQTKPQEKA